MFKSLSTSRIARILALTVGEPAQMAGLVTAFLSGATTPPAPTSPGCPDLNVGERE